MARSLALSQIENAIPIPAVRAQQNTALAEMAADPQIRRELAAISDEFAHTEMDGLEQLCRARQTAYYEPDA